MFFLKKPHQTKQNLEILHDVLADQDFVVTQILRAQRKICWDWKTPQLCLKIIFLKVPLRIVPSIDNSLRGCFFKHAWYFKAVFFGGGVMLSYTAVQKLPNENGSIS